MSSTVTISGHDFTIYGSSAVAYVTGMVGAGATAWLALTSTEQARSLVAATRMLDRQAWVDAYDTFAARDAVADIVSASYELAVAIAADPTVQDNPAVGDKNVRRVDAKGVSVEFFGVVQGGRFPTVVQELVGAYLASAAGSIGVPVVSGTCQTPRVGDCADEFDLTDGI